jgi:hypothetical protein
MSLGVSSRAPWKPILPFREVEDEVKGQSSSTGFAEIHAVSMKRLSKVEAADDPSDGVRTVAGHECTRL